DLAEGDLGVDDDLRALAVLAQCRADAHAVGERVVGAGRAPGRHARPGPVAVEVPDDLPGADVGVDGDVRVVGDGDGHGAEGHPDRDGDLGGGVEPGEVDGEV